MLLTASGMTMLVRAVQPEKAEAPMLVTVSGSSMPVSAVQPENAPGPMAVIGAPPKEAGRVTSPEIEGSTAVRMVPPFSKASKV